MSRLRLSLPHAWLTRGALAWVLRPISLCFECLVACRQWLYRLGALRPQKLRVPVVVVGNVLVGGVGKTPVVIALVKHLQQRGLRVGVLSRGYGRVSRDVREVHPNSRADEVGDEPLLIARACGVPVWVGANRVEAGQSLLEHDRKTQVLVCDDGLQHLALARDIELCVFDERGIGNGWMLPAGPLREPWPRAENSHIDRFELSHGAAPVSGRFQVHKKLADFAVRADGTRRPLPTGFAHPVQALAGIAKPQVFFNMLEELGLTLSYTQALPDHAALHGVSIDKTMGELLCTEKDAVKLWIDHPEAWAVPLITNLPTDLLQALDGCLDRRLSSRHGLKIT